MLTTGFRQKLTSVFHPADTIPSRPITSTKRKYRAPSDAATSPTDSTFAADHLLSSSPPPRVPQVKRSRHSTEETLSDNTSGSSRYHFRQRTSPTQLPSPPTPNTRTSRYSGMPKSRYPPPTLPLPPEFSLALLWALVLICCRGRDKKGTGGELSLSSSSNNIANKKEKKPSSRLTSASTNKQNKGPPLARRFHLEVDADIW